MTSVVPQVWPNTGMTNQPQYPLQGQDHYTPQQALAGQQKQQQQQQQQQQLYLPNGNSEQNHQYQLPSHHLNQYSTPPNNELPRSLLPINQEYDLNYPYNDTLYKSSSGRDTSLRVKTSKRLSKALPPDPLMKQRQRSIKNGSMNKNQTSVTGKDPSHPTSTFVHSDSQYQQEQSRGASSSTNAEAEQESHKEPEFVPYLPPASKKGLPIDRPYSYYKVAPKVPQSVTVIDSPFGPPVSLPTTVESQRNFTNGNSSTTYYTHPSSSNPFVPPAQFQPSLLHQQQQQQQHLYQPATHGSGFKKDNSVPEDSVPERSEEISSIVLSDSMPAQGPRERSNSDRQFHRPTSPRPDRTEVPETRQPLEMNHQNRGYGNDNGSQPARERQQLNYHGRQDNETTNRNTQESSRPARKVSGNSLLRIARKASDSALKGMGLSRKPSSDKKASQNPGLAAVGTTYEQNSQGWSTANSRSQPDLHRGQQPEFPTHAEPGSREYNFSGAYDTDLGRNKSLPDFKPSSTADQRNPIRGSSLNNPKTNPGPFHSRQKSQHHLQGTFQAVTAMSNEPTTTTAVSSSTSNIIQDAYGGTTDDWRQKQQAEKEARQRQQLRDSSPNERQGHSSINSVSTLNLPPTTVVPTTTTVNRSTSRILLPDRDRSTNPSKSTQSSSNPGTEDMDPEPTQESTSLAKATVQPGGILAQLQAATEAGHVIDPAMGVWSQKDGRYIQRSNTAPYPLRENRTILEEDESVSPTSGGSMTLGPLEYSKSEGYSTSRNNRQQKQLRQQQIQQQQQHLQQQYQNQQLPQEQLYNQQQYPDYNDLYHQPHQQPSYQANHLPHQQQQNQFQQPPHHQQPQPSSRSRAMSNEQTVDTNKDLPPTPAWISQGAVNDSTDQQAAHGGSRDQRTDIRSQGQRQTRSRSESRSESAHRHQNQQSLGWQAGISKISESALALSRSLSPPPNKGTSRDPPVNNGQVLRKESNGYHTLNKSSSSGDKKEKDRYGTDMLPLPVIPSPDETLNKNANVGILPQDVLRTLDSQTIQKVITQAVISSRVYKALSFEEVENLKKEQDDLYKYVEALKVSLTIETRMRDASHSLIRLHETNTNIDAVKAATGQLHATTRKMDQIVQKSQQAMDRLLVIQRLLLQHEGAVLNAGMRRLDGDNRELTRVVQELEKVKDQEKEEKLKWKKEHSNLRIQSMIFPNPPGLGEPPNSGQKLLQLPQQQPRTPTPPLQQQQQHAASMAALEGYIKELVEDINKKDEHIGQLESQLRLIKVWADDFSGSLGSKLGVDNNSQIGESTSVMQSGTESSPILQKQLAQLRSRIEDGFRALEANAHELKSKAQEAEAEKNKALEFAATTLANTTVVAGPTGEPAGSSSTSSVGGSESPRSKSRQIEQQQGSRLRNPLNRSKTSLNESRPHQTNHSNNSDLNMVFNESLLELDLQLSTSSSANSPTPDVAAGRVQQSSRDDSTKSPMQRQELTRRTSRSKQQPENKDELLIGDAHEEIKRLNAMVDELERLVKLKLN